MNTEKDQLPVDATPINAILEVQATKLWWEGLVEMGLIQAIAESQFRLSADLLALWRELRLSQKLTEKRTSLLKFLQNTVAVLNPVAAYQRLQTPKSAAVDPMTLVLFRPEALSYEQLKLVAGVLGIPFRNRKNQLLKQKEICLNSGWEIYRTQTFAEVSQIIVKRTGLVATAAVEYALEQTPPVRIPTNIDPV